MVLLQAEEFPGAFQGKGSKFSIRSRTHDFIVDVRVILVKFYTVGVVEQLDIRALENIAQACIQVRVVRGATHWI